MELIVTFSITECWQTGHEFCQTGSLPWLRLTPIPEYPVLLGLVARLTLSEKWILRPSGAEGTLVLGAASARIKSTTN